ncbi:MAG: aminoacyl-tRNA hydrolase [Bacteroidales bacterium]|jgi:PTH1 family peptidyl-tRNA hydrolase|nr:aminoacyl-tRNA hydrolase [Bacteroidales bacterium]MDD3299509.1 aminoacyl-tRNA hydrolase [Bacteroidales bacterium]MDD3844233.1 aminoacyl-tRNA hydrolase [Bacteroidales bacterium]MDD4618661.1 aminoacyl-tRNA hydrolase [Bacteroidales bacterium]
MSYLVVGLGNIGEEYADTRHNIGFMVLDAWAQASNIVFRSERYGAVCETRFRGQKIILLKPSTYMNLSGKAVNYWLQKEKVPIENLLVIVDDIALPLGTLRMRKQGSDGGHNGLKDIAGTLLTNSYSRLRFGIGDGFSRGSQINYVLGSWSEEERKQLPSLLEKAVEASKSFVAIGAERTMNIYNTK